MTPADDMRPAAATDLHYAQWKGWHAEGFGQASRSDRRYYAWHLARCMGPHARTTGLRVLEIGYGNGGFMGWAREQGHVVTGIEVQPALLERARAAGWTVVQSLSTLAADAEFDLIVAFDVLEHVPPADLTTFMSGITQHLAGSGRLLLRMPNGDSPFGRPNQHGDLTHVAAYGLSKLHQLAELHELEVVAYGEAPWYRQQGLSRNLTNAVRAAARRLLEGWIRFAYGWSTLSLAPNLVVVLQRRDARSIQQFG